MTIKFVICGLEHSGTTLISDLFRQVKGLDAGFEVGVLMVETPDQFQSFEPFSNNLLSGWGINDAEFKNCCEAATHDEFYQRLQLASTEIAGETVSIFDKTPRYLSRLSECLGRTDVPFIASYKDPRATVHSDFKRAGTDNFDQWYRDYMPKKRHYLRSCYREFLNTKSSSDRVAFISLEELALNARHSMDRIFDHVGISFSLDYVLLNGLRYKNTRSNAVSIPIAFSYLADFDKTHTDRIEKDFGEFDEWFYR